MRGFSWKKYIPEEGGGRILDLFDFAVHTPIIYTLINDSMQKLYTLFRNFFTMQDVTFIIYDSDADSNGEQEDLRYKVGKFQSFYSNQENIKGS